jgi:chromosome segregation ATPase
VSVTLLAIVGAVIAPLLTYLVAARKLSGKIATTEASDLWEESRSIREDLTKRNEYLRDLLDRYEQRLDAAEAKLGELEERNHVLYLENVDLRAKVNQHEQTISKLKAENTKLRKRILTLEKA